MAANLEQALSEGNGEKAVRVYWDLVDQAYGRTAQQVEVRAGSIENIGEIPTEELKLQAAELRARLGQEELPARTS